MGHLARMQTSHLPHIYSYCTTASNAKGCSVFKNSSEGFEIGSIAKTLEIAVHQGPVVQKPRLTLTWGKKLTEVYVSLVKKRFHC